MPAFGNAVRCPLRAGAWRFLGLCVLALLLLPRATAQTRDPKTDPRIDLQEHLGAPVPLDLTFTNEAGQVVPLRQYVDGHQPVVLLLAYYQCPMLCTLVLDGAANAARSIDFAPGKEYRIVTVSINPHETPAMALTKRDNLLRGLPHASGPDAWHCLVGSEDHIHQLAEAVGFKFFYDADINEYAHPAALIVLTPDGRISRYLYGMQFPAPQFRLALVEGGEGKVGSIMDRLILSCYHYDPKGKGYTLAATRVMQAGGLLTLVILAGALALFWAWERRQRRRRGAVPLAPVAAAPH